MSGLYHTFFIKEFLKNIEENMGTMHGNCNAGETKITKRGYFGQIRVWLNESGIANLLPSLNSRKMGTRLVPTPRGSGKFTPQKEKSSCSREIQECAQGCRTSTYETTSRG